MECSLSKLYEEDNSVIVMGKVVRLEVADEILTADGAIDVAMLNNLR